MNDYVTKLQKERAKMKEISSSTNYINWLEKFTEKYPHFENETWFYSTNDISDEDMQNVIDLHLLFKVIDNYAEENFLESDSSDLGFSNEYYQIKYNNIFYQITVMTGQGTAFLCQRLNNFETEKTIDFNDILQNKKQPKTLEIEEMLNIFTDHIKQMINSNVPKWAIENTFKKAINN